MKFRLTALLRLDNQPVHLSCSTPTNRLSDYPHLASLLAEAEEVTFEPRCLGCQINALGQRAHMGTDGCLSDDNETCSTSN